jgi:hypothetical protein
MNPGKITSKTVTYELSGNNLNAYPGVERLHQIEIQVHNSGYTLHSYDSSILNAFKLTLEGYIP